jgi:two-component system, OmpR family, catabolic regulation response regulator CreB
MTPPSVFIVDDEPAIAEAVGFALQAEGYRCLHCATGSACLEALARERPALILLDVGLPDGSGFDVFRRIRALSDVPVVFLTARKEEIDRVVGLEMGADDYVVKPFSLRELVARVRMVIRRGSVAAPAAPRLAAPPGAPAASSLPADMPRRLGPFEHDAVRRLMRYRGRALELTLHEYRLLEVLLAHPGRVYSRAELLERAWEAPDHRLERTVDSHVKSLRAKLREVDPAGDPIRTHRGSGYSLDLAP